MAPLNHRLATPMVALTVVLKAAASSTSANTWRSRSSDGRNRATRWSSRAPTTASRVFPTPIPAAPASGTPAEALTRNAPIAMPGQ